MIEKIRAILRQSLLISKILFSFCIIGCVISSGIPIIKYVIDYIMAIYLLLPTKWSLSIIISTIEKHEYQIILYMFATLGGFLFILFLVCTIGFFALFLKCAIKKLLK